MRKFAIFCIAVAVAAIISGSLIQARHKTTAGAIGIDTTELTFSAGWLPTQQVNEPF